MTLSSLITFIMNESDHAPPSKDKFPCELKSVEHKMLLCLPGLNKKKSHLF